MSVRVVTTQAELDQAIADGVEEISASEAYGLAMRVAELSEIDKGTGCRLWTGSNDGRYGRVSFRDQLWMAHRLAYVVNYGPIPGLDVDHLCRNTFCVEVSHLEAVPHDVNVRRAAAFREACKWGHLWVPENTSITPRGHRRCRACNRREMRKRDIRRRAQVVREVDIDGRPVEAVLSAGGLR